MLFLVLFILELPQSSQSPLEAHNLEFLKFQPFTYFELSFLCKSLFLSSRYSCRRNVFTKKDWDCILSTPSSTYSSEGILKLSHRVIRLSLLPPNVKAPKYSVSFIEFGTFLVPFAVTNRCYMSSEWVVLFDFFF